MSDACYRNRKFHAGSGEAGFCRYIDYTMGTASMLGHYEALGYICMGVLAFALGVCVTVLLYRLRRVEEHKRRTREYQYRMETDGQPEKKKQQEEQQEEQEKEREEREREQR